MKLTLASRSQNYIKAYQADSIELAANRIYSNCLIAPERIIIDWTARDVASLVSADLAPVFELQPEVVIMGTGMKQRFPAATISAAFLARAIGFEVMDLGAACRTFNVLLSEDRRVVAALFVNNHKSGS